MSRRSLLVLPMLSASAPADSHRLLDTGDAARAARATPEPPLKPREVERFREAILPYLDGAYAFARFLCRDNTLAEDIVQDACLRACRSFRGYRGENGKAWLFAIVRSSFLTWARSRKGSHEVADDEALANAHDDAETPEGLVLREAADAAVRRAVDALPAPFREAIVLRELQDMSYREIADITGVPIGTVMSRLARARSLLAAALAAEART